MAFIARRLAFYVVAIWAAVTINFMIPRVMPGNAVDAAISKFTNLTPQVVKSLEIEFGFHPKGSIFTQYLQYWDNVLHFRGAAAGQPVLGCPDHDPAHFVTPDRPWIGCVWELPPILHERDAWVRHMLVPESPDIEAYLADTLPEGTTGDRS